jgi:hypothetical protein
MRYQTTRTIASLKVCAIVLSLAAAASGCNGSPDGPSPNRTFARRVDTHRAPGVPPTACPSGAVSSSASCSRVVR